MTWYVWWYDAYGDMLLWHDTCMVWHDMLMIWHMWHVKIYGMNGMQQDVFGMRYNPDTRMEDMIKMLWYEGRC